MRQKMADMVHRIQDEICLALKEIDGVNFRQDEWTREEGGGGRSRVFSGGEVFEKAGVNVSVVYGTLSPQAAKSMGGGHELQGKDLDFYATGLSLVLHPLIQWLLLSMQIIVILNAERAKNQAVGGLVEGQI